MNTLLREHLDKASEVNSALKEDVGKLTVDWMRAREELELKESEWRSEREVRIGYGNARQRGMGTHSAPGIENLLCGSCGSAEDVLVLDRGVGGRSVSRWCSGEMLTCCHCTARS